MQEVPGTSRGPPFDREAGIGRYKKAPRCEECGLVGLRKTLFSYMPGTLFRLVVGMNMRGVRP